MYVFNANILRAMTQYRLPATARGYTFKSSRDKTSQEQRFLATNLHVHTMAVLNLPPLSLNDLHPDSAPDANYSTASERNSDTGTGCATPSEPGQLGVLDGNLRVLTSTSIAQGVSLSAERYLALMSG